MSLNKMAYRWQQEKCIRMDEEAGSKHSEVVCEAVGSVGAAATQRTQAVTAPAPLFNTEELAQHAEHTH